MKLPKKYITDQDLTEFNLGNKLTTQSHYKLNELFSHVQEVGTKTIYNEFEFSQEDKIVWLKIIAYLIQSKSLCNFFSIDIRKGLMILGPVGCGKTTIFEIVKQITVPGEKFLIKSCSKILLEFRLKGNKVIETYTDVRYHGFRHILFDDLGTEISSKHFGTENNLIGEILTYRYDLYRTRGIKSHISTNLNSDEIEVGYGQRVRSRLRQMVNVISYSLSAEDKRK